MAIIILLTIAVGTLIYMAYQMRNNRRIGAVGIVENIDAAIERLDGSVRHHTEVNAVIALTEAVGRHPELIANIEAYSHDVVAASLINRVNTLGRDLSEAQNSLSHIRRVQNQRPNSFTVKEVERLETECARLQQQLMEANGAVQAFTRLQPVR